MGFSTLSIRGDSNFRWMIDGVYLDPSMGSRFVRSIPVAAIEEVKVVRGSSALTFGPMTNTENPSGGAAVDGFIVVRTRKPQKTEAQARMALESNGGEQHSVWLGKTLGGDNKAYLAALVSHNENGSPGDRLDNGKKYNVDRESDNLLLRGGIEVTGVSLDLMAYKDHGSYQIPNTNSHVTSPGNNDWFVSPSETTIVGLSGNRSWDARNTTLFSLSSARGEQTVTSRSGSADAAALKTNTSNIVKATHINVRHVMALDVAKVTAGIDYRHWDVPNGQNPAYYPGIRREEVTRGWFVQAEKDLMDGRLSLDGSIRQDKVEQVHGLNFIFTGVGSSGSVASTQISNVELPNARFWTLGSRYKLGKQWALLARYGRASQPLTAEIKAAPGVKLQADAQTKWELGVEGNLSRAANLSLNYFSREARNEKQVFAYTTAVGSCTASSPTSPTVTAIVPCYGQGDTTRAGVEAAVAGELGVATRYRLSWTHFTELAGSVNKAPLADQTPRNVAEFMVSHPIDRFTLTGAIKHVSQYNGAANGTVGSLPFSGGYTKLDLGVGYDWKYGATQMRTGFYVRNLTDRKFETAVGIQDVGRVVGVELQASF
jgi:iron complex outermembrane receptor protein